MKRWLALVVAGFTVWVSAAETNHEVFEYQAYARNAAHKVFLAKLEIGDAQVKLGRAQAQKSINDKLWSIATSKFERQNLKLRVAEAQFAVDRGMYHLEEAKAFESMYKLKIDLIKNKKDIKKGMAEINVTISAKRLKLLKDLKVALVDYMEILTSQKNDSEGLFRSGALAKEAWDQIEIGYDAMVALDKENNAEIILAQAELDAAQVDAL